jgi:hypothetical protein
VQHQTKFLYLVLINILKVDCLYYVMENQEKVICKPTKWFLLRAIAMFCMFFFLGCWFYKDGTTGYRNQNKIFFMDKAFSKAFADYENQSKLGSVSALEWEKYVKNQTIDFGKDLTILPKDFKNSMSLPFILHDVEMMKKGKFLAWNQFSGENHWAEKAPEKLHEAGSLREQMILAVVLFILAIITLFFLVRTSRRKIEADSEKITTQEGKEVFYKDLKQLDLRKWNTKGLAFATYVTSSEKIGKIRFDGLTYGGFKQEDGEPAEALMKKVKRYFTGELIEYSDDKKIDPVS